jgi:APA family basic amino acid/polyamine antiporter
MYYARWEHDFQKEEYCMDNGQKRIGTVALFAIASGTMISSGIFILPGLAYSQLGPAVIFSYLLAGVVALLSSLSLIELATAMPRAGGDYFYITRSMGPGVGTVMGLLSWLALILKTAFAVYGLSELGYIFFSLPPRPTALVLTGLFMILNLAGTGEAVKLEIALVFALLAIMAGFVILGTGSWNPGYFHRDLWQQVVSAPQVPAASLPFIEDLRRLFSSSAFVFVSFGGLLNVSTMAEEVREPGKAIPRAMLLSVGLISVLYVAMVGTVAAVLPPADFAGSLAPIADAARRILGPTGAVIIAIASALAFVTTGNAGLMSASRYPLAMGRDQLLPPAVGTLSRRGIPVPAILLTGAGIAVAVLIPLESLVKLASTVILLTYIAINISVIILRESGVRNYRPLYHAPWYPVTPVAALMLMGYFLIELGVSSLEILLLFAGAGLLMYLLYGRTRSRYEYAALHLVKKIVDRRLGEEGLERELRDIIRNREELSSDIVDRLIETAIFLDIDHPETRQGAFYAAGSALAGKTGLTSEEITRQLEYRESQMSTALSAFVSIPHVLIPDAEDIHLCLIRCRNGMYFDQAHPSIRAMIIIVGSQKRRNDHLAVLSGLARIIQHEDFETIWTGAESMRSLADELILLERSRVNQVHPASSGPSEEQL